MITHYSRQCIVRLATLLGVIGIALVCSVVALAADLVILKDGFVIQGMVRKEGTTISDPPSGKLIPVAKVNGYDLVDEGPKFVFFSAHSRQLVQVTKDVKLRPAYKSYIRNVNGRKGNDALPSFSGVISISEYNANWLRTIKVAVPPNSFDIIEEQITYIDPFFMRMWSPTHSWASGYRTAEFDPAKVRKLLSTHPELAERNGKPDAGKRIAIAKFTLDAGWLEIAKDDLDNIKTLFPDGIPMDAKESFDKFSREIDTATAALVIREAELALGAGRYNYAADLLSAFPEKLADARQQDDASKLMAQLKATHERYESGRRLLRALLDEVTGLDRAHPALAVGGGLVIATWPTRAMTSPLPELVAAGEQVFNEMHPDTATRLESFVSLAAQAEREKLQGRDPTKTPRELLATAISGWALGKNGANPDPAAALKIWGAREAVLAFQRSDDLSTRNSILTKYKKANLVSIDELTQIITLLPPVDPENLIARTGTPIRARAEFPGGIYKRITAPTQDHPVGQSYYIKLPPEYHHGRAYPVVIFLGSPTSDTEKLIAELGKEADRYGYIILAPDWANQFGKGWQWRGEDHWFVTGVLRDAVRNFCIDNDRVFMIGFADGANMAMDIGMSHPDLFAGIIPVAPIPKPKFFTEYWKNAQALPFYVVTGEAAGDSHKQLRDQLFDHWMPWGFSALLSVYKGRGIEWYPAETPVMFDWMNRKKRVATTGVLKLDERARKDWQTMRKTDNHFYWLQVDDIDSRNLLSSHPSGQVIPASIQGDVKGNNNIRITTRGVKKLSILLTAELIDWSKGVTVTINSVPAPGYNRPKTIEPDLELMLDDYRERGDRRVLVWGRLEFKTVP